MEEKKKWVVDGYDITVEPQPFIRNAKEAPHVTFEEEDPVVVFREAQEDAMDDNSMPIADKLDLIGSSEDLVDEFQEEMGDYYMRMLMEKQNEAFTAERDLGGDPEEPQGFRVHQKGYVDEVTQDWHAEKKL